MDQHNALPEQDDDLSNSIAIVGMSGRFPGANDVATFWQNLCDGVESITHFSDEELEDDFDAEVRNDPNFVKARPILEDVDKFDAEFFSMYAKEAALTDPQQRLFLECSWEALEDAGYDPARIDTPVGVFGGSSMNTYMLRHLCANPATVDQFTSSYQVGQYPMFVGSAPDFFATRVAYKLDLKGPAVNVSSACSTSLLAIAQACQSLQLYQCDMALAGGASITFPQKRGYLHQEGGMVSPDGHCRAFDANAAGTIFGSAVGSVLLKRYDDAIADGDQIYAVIRGCGINNDGADKAGFTAPSVDGQAAAIREALDVAEVDARSIGYVECHGTGTPLGDPIEIAGLTQAYRDHTSDTGYCAIGSLKTNVGHLDAAAGVTGLIKTALALKNAKLPATLHYETPNPRIDFANSPFHVNDRLNDWPQREYPRRAGLSSFGVGGTNVHLVLEEAPAREETFVTDNRPQLLVCSARTPEALQQAQQNLAAHLRNHPEQPLADAAYTLMEGRRAFEHRAVVVANSHEEAARQLSSGSIVATQAGSQRPVVFLFPGQGTQYPEMGRDLYENEPVFRAALDECAALLQPQLGEDLRALLYPSDATDKETAAERLRATILAQPAIFSVEYATAQLWLSRGIQPSAMLGHSVGEWVAAVLAGVVSLKDALTLVATRGRLMNAVAGGAMLSVRLPEADLLPLLNEQLDIAAINAPNLCVVAGPYDAIDALEQLLDTREVVHRRLHTSHAFHSAMMDEAVAPLLDAVSQVQLSAPTLPIYSCVSGQPLRDEEATSAEYWAHHMREAVRYADGIRTLVEQQSNAILLEIGPGNTLTTLAHQCLRGVENSDIRTLHSLPDAGRDSADHLQMLQCFGLLWAHGAEVDWQQIHQGTGQRVSLPTYPFQRQSHWVERPARNAAANTVPSCEQTLTDPSEPVTQTEQTPDSAPVNDTRQQVLAIFEELSGENFDGISDSTGFVELGFDSLFLTQVAQRLQKQFRVKLTFRQLLGDYGRLGLLVSMLEREGQATQPKQVNQKQESAPAPQASTTVTPVLPEDEAESRPSRFDLYKGKQGGNTELTEKQAQHIAELAERSASRMRGSRQSTRSHRKVLADPRAAAGFCSDLKELVYPIVVDRSKGSRLWDIDGNEYVDLVNGYGQTFFGHSPDFVTDAMREQLEKGFAIGPQAEFAGEVASLFSEITGNERVTFCNTGSEAVMAAMRVARAVTGRDKVVVFNGDYHGQFDEVLVKGVGRGERRRSQPIAGGIPPEAVANMEVLEYGAADSLAWIQAHADDIAAVVVEPVQSRHPDLRPFAFLRELRNITQQTGSALVFDEVVTGFRTHPGGIQAVTGIRADLATYGKVVGGGMPIGILAGRAEFMDALDGGQWDYGDDSIPEVGVTFFAGTFVRHPMTLSATRAVLHHMLDAGPQLQDNLAARTAGLVAQLRNLFTQFGLKTEIEHYSSFFYFNLHNELAYPGLVYYHLRERGIHIQDGFACFMTTAHSDEDLQRIVDAFRDTLQALADADLLPNHLSNSGTPVVDNTKTAELIPLTESQMEIWLAAQLSDAASCVFNEAVTVELTGTLNSTALERALDQLVARHDALRSRFLPTGEAFSIKADGKYSFQRHQAATQAQLDEAIASEARQVFDLINGPLLRVQLFSLSDNNHTLILSTHHIVCDGWSINVLVSELGALYKAELRGGMALLPDPLPFSRYAQRESNRDPQEQQRIDRYWQAQFNPPPAALVLPSDRPRSSVPSYRGATYTASMSAAFCQQLKQAGATQGATLFTTLLTGFQTLMGRLAGQNDLVIGVPTAGQAQLEDETLVGHCVHFLPIRSQWQADSGLAEQLKHTSNQVMDAYDHQGTTLGALVQQLELPRQQGQVPLTQVQFNLERLESAQPWPELEVSVSPNPKAFVNFDLFFNMIESAQGLRLDVDYNSDLFDQATIAHWVEVFEQLLSSMVDSLTHQPQHPLSQLNWLPARDQQQLAQLNATVQSYPQTLCLDQLLLKRAAQQPDAIAVRCNGIELSYAELDTRANQLANHLRCYLSLREDDAQAKVGICVRRSVDTLIAMLATLKAGAAYVPLDPCHPHARLQYILDDAGVAALIVDAEQHNSLNTDGLPLIDPSLARCDNGSAELPDLKGRSPQDLAYVIYTSGSTGKPKGVEISHQAAVNFLCSMAKEPGLEAEDRFLAVTTVSFDISLLELFLPLLCGAQLVIAGDEDTPDGFRLKALIDTFGITAMQGTPSSWQLLLEAGFVAPDGFKMLIGGEALPRQLADRLLAGDGELWNMYGPTETTVWSSCQRIQADGQPITVGQPIANTSFYILDEHDQPQPQGVPGQLHIGGDGVARGYLNRADLTAERFIPNPFGEGRLYRTGDLARLLPDGNLQVIGRIDHQVKLRGFRIELGEIEAQLHSAGAQATVIVREDSPGARRLVAYLETSGNCDQQQLRRALERSLPEYMVPSVWVTLDALPRLANGKLDRNALPQPDATHSVGPVYRAPQTTQEQTLASIWAEVLGLEQVGLDDDLFALGADSIQIFQIVARASKAGLPLSASQLMQHRRLLAVAASLNDPQDPFAMPGRQRKKNRGRIRKLYPESV